MAAHAALALKNADLADADLTGRLSLTTFRRVEAVHDAMVQQLEETVPGLSPDGRQAVADLIELFGAAMLRMRGRLEAQSILRLPVDVLPWRGRAA